MGVRPEDFYGGAIHTEITANTELSAISRVMTFATNVGTWDVTFAAGAADLARRMDYTWMGGAAVYLINAGPGALNVSINIGGTDGITTLALGAAQSARVIIFETNNAKPTRHTAPAIVAPDTSKAFSSAVGQIKTATDGIVHTGGDPGVTTTEIVDMPTGSWSAGPTMPAHGDAAGFSVHGGLHLLGSNNPADRQIHSRYRGGSSVARTQYPIELENSAGGSLKGVGYVFEADIDAALAAKPVGTRDYVDLTDSFSSKAAQPHPSERAGSASVPAWDRIMIVRGDPRQQASWLYHGPTGTFESVDFYSGTAKRSMSCFTHLGKVYSCGGYDDNAAEWKDTTDIFDIATRSWAVGPTMPAARSEGAAFAWGAVGLYAGGEDSGGSATSTVFRMNSSSAWFTSTAKSIANENSSQHGAEINL